MEHFEKALPPEGAAKPAQISTKIYEIGGRERLFFVLTLAFALLFVDTFLWNGPVALSLTLVVFAWCALTLACTGPLPLLRPSNCVLLLFNLFLALTLALSSSWTFQVWNTLALLVLLPVQTVAFSSAARLPWWRPAMLGERFLLLFRGLFGHLGAAPAALCPGKKAAGSKQLFPVLAGGLAAAVLVAFLLPVLASADALFAAATLDLRVWFRTHLTESMLRFLWALALTPFLFGLLYSLRHSAPLKEHAAADRSVNGISFTVILAALDLLYLLFLAVQSAGLFGGPDYLAGKGISYAEWARSGFFQMVGVTVANLTAAMASLSLSRREGKSWPAIRLLTALLILESLVLLASAAWRMTLYVSAYGLSFKRCMTYWGMVMMALFLLAALQKARTPDFRFCKAAFPLALACWLVINCIPVDYLVAGNQVERYLSGKSDSIDVEYLLYDLSYDTLAQLDRLDGNLIFRDALSGGPVRYIRLSSLLADRREEARADCADWHSWSLSAWLAANGT